MLSYAIVLDPIHKPTKAPTALRIIDEVENRPAPHKSGMSPPIVDPAKIPSQIRDCMTNALITPPSIPAARFTLGVILDGAAVCHAASRRASPLLRMLRSARSFSMASIIGGVSERSPIPISPETAALIDSRLGVFGK